MKPEINIYRQDYWKTQWNSLNNKTNAFAGYYSVSTWDAMAACYGKQLNSNDGDDPVKQTIQRLENSGFVINGSRILDVGCGNGRYTREFARRGADVVGVDISEKMITRLKSESESEEFSGITPIIADWKTVDVGTIEFGGLFDLVFANMTPAVTDPDSFIKLIKASKRWCWFCGWAGQRKNQLIEYIYRKLNGCDPHTFMGNFICAWNLVCASGYFPDSTFKTVQWTDNKLLDDCIEFYATFFSGGNEANKKVLADRINIFLSDMVVNGVVENTVAGHTGSMLWSI